VEPPPELPELQGGFFCDEPVRASACDRLWRVLCPIRTMAAWRLSLHVQACEQHADALAVHWCHSQGLGKTVTALSLILRTKGTLPTPPQGAQV
jgi:hypothetical protein